MNLNKVYLIGRLASDPEFRTTPGGQEVATLRMATNRVWNDRTSGQRNEATEFHTIVVWGRLAQIANQYLNKGSLAMIEGRLQTRSWDGQDGVKRYRTEIIAEGLQLGPKPMGGKAPENRNEQISAKTAESKEEIPVVNEEETPSPGEGSSDSDSALSGGTFDEKAEIASAAEDIEEGEVKLKDVPF